MNKPADKVLIVDDEENITDLLSTAMKFVGFDIATAATGREALQLVNTFRPDVLVLDVMLKDLDGFEVCRRMRLEGINLPVLFLTARDASEDKIRGLTIGGDDYVTKPFSLEEVVARIRAILRRTQEFTDDSRLRYEDLELDDDTHEVFRGEERIDLSPTEFNLLRYLLLNAGRVLSKSQILDHVWQYDFGGDAAIVETYISYLRKKIDKGRTPLIHTMRGVGYTLRHKS